MSDSSPITTGGANLAPPPPPPARPETVAGTQRGPRTGRRGTRGRVPGRVPTASPHCVPRLSGSCWCTRSGATSPGDARTAGACVRSGGCDSCAHSPCPTRSRSPPSPPLPTLTPCSPCREMRRPRRRRARLRSRGLHTARSGLRAQQLGLERRSGRCCAHCGSASLRYAPTARTYRAAPSSYPLWWELVGYSLPPDQRRTQPQRPPPR
mmetsp:Transcript_23913/g.59652  ORF Transcript_23913/g.59652 Transcript_23913/m.59652 type:complete len:209 (+) Transcript_23913:848-1474(+)